MNLKEVHKKLFYFLIFLLPVNLGKHLVYRWSYINGLLVDYLIPTIYVTDILSCVILLLWVFDGKVKKFSKYFGIYFWLVLFLFSGILSTYIAVNMWAGVYFWLRMILYVGMFFYVICEFNFKRDIERFISVSTFSLFFVSILGLIQWILQSSVFNNYLFFGEQPYSFLVKGASVQNFFGFARIPAYGLFSHPNVFSGYLVILLLFIFYWILRYGKFTFNFLCMVFVLGCVSLFYTLSYFSWFVLIFGLVSLCTFLKFSNSNLFKVFLLGSFILMCGLALLPFFVDGSAGPSLLRRSNFLKSSYGMWNSSQLFGVGLNNNIVLMEDFMPVTNDLRFIQPVHNVFMLILTETGIVGFGIFLIFLISLLRHLFIQRNYALGVIVVCILLLGSFDHYLWTIHQTFLLFWLTIAISITYNSRNEI